MAWVEQVWGWLRGLGPTRARRPAFTRQPITHVVILDGTMSSLAPGCETHAGITYKLLREVPAVQVSLYYEAGIQWQDWRRAHHVITGRGINRQIRRAYGYLASRYHPGDRIILMGYSRGAFAVRSLAGVIDRVGLLRSEHATERNVRQAYRHYQAGAGGNASRAFGAAYCHDGAEVEMLGVWDTVKALGVRLPVLWKLTERDHAFHNHTLGPMVRRGYHALAMDETRQIFAPVLWECPPDWNGRVEQVWFRGCHGDIGGQLGGFEPARPLANIPLVWMLSKLEACDVALPQDWLGRFPCDPQAPSVGSFRSWGKLLLARKRREIGRDPSEILHPTAHAAPPQAGSLPDYEPERA
ncbi:DUF2235 domain-containing protein [Actibacterium sp. D379-3]